MEQRAGHIAAGHDQRHRVVHIVLVIVDDIVVGTGDLKLLHRDGGGVDTVTGLNLIFRGIEAVEKTTVKVGWIFFTVPLEIAQAGFTLTKVSIGHKSLCVSYIFCGHRAVDLGVVPVDALLLHLDEDIGSLVIVVGVEVPLDIEGEVVDTIGALDYIDLAELLVAGLAFLGGDILGRGDLPDIGGVLVEVVAAVEDRDAVLVAGHQHIAPIQHIIIQCDPAAKFDIVIAGSGEGHGGRADCHAGGQRQRNHSFHILSLLTARGCRFSAGPGILSVRSLYPISLQKKSTFRSRNKDFRRKKLPGQRAHTATALTNRRWLPFSSRV